MPAQDIPHASGPSAVIQSFTTSLFVKSIEPPAAGVVDVVGSEEACFSEETLAAFRRMLIPLSSWVVRTVAIPFIPSVVVVSPGRLFP